MLNKRELLIKKATELFAQGGYNAVGIDKILAEAGVAKMTMYKYFPSKNDLIAEVLKERDKTFRSSLMAFVDLSDSFFEKIRAIFIWHDKWFKRRGFYGCMFINASAEFHNRKDEIHKVSAEHKHLITAFIESILVNVSPLKSKELAAQISMLLDGAIVAAHVTGNSNAAMEAWDAAQSLLASTGKRRAVKNKRCAALVTPIEPTE